MTGVWVDVPDELQIHSEMPFFVAYLCWSKGKEPAFAMDVRKRKLEFPQETIHFAVREFFGSVVSFKLHSISLFGFR